MKDMHGTLTASERRRLAWIFWGVFLSGIAAAISSVFVAAHFPSIFH
jgi:hypothetical protein